MNHYASVVRSSAGWRTQQVRSLTREAHVWYVVPDELNDASQLNAYMELLSPSERKKVLSMRGEKLQKCAVLSRALLRTTLSRYTGGKTDPRSFEFKKNKFGKPEILWQPEDNCMEQHLHFNISHTSSLIACGIAIGVPIGIDVEENKRKTTKNILSLAHRYFSPYEGEYLAAICDSDAQQKEFVKLWTLKEAYVKALGRGFSGAPFSNFTIQLETSKGGIQVSKNSRVHKDSNFDFNCLTENWQFALVELNSSHYMAICIENDSKFPGSENDPLPLELKVWKTIPFVEDTLVSGTEAMKLMT